MQSVVCADGTEAPGEPSLTRGRAALGRPYGAAGRPDICGELSLQGRGGTLSLAPLVGLLPVVVAMILGAVSAAAHVGTVLVHRVSERLLERFILVFLVVIDSALIVEAHLP